MKRTVSIGAQNFAVMREMNDFLVDKSRFISDWWDGRDIVTLITRPRRFGKSLCLSMVKSFFSLDYAGRSDLFDGLEIFKGEDGERFRSLQGTYPVIYLSFADISSTTFQEAKNRVVYHLKELFEDFEDLREETPLLESENAVWTGLYAQKPDNTVVSMSLKMLSKYLYRHYGKKPIILLDEYDAPLNAAYVNGYWDEMVQFQRDFFSALLKNNEYFERALLTGITRAAKESIFSGLNNLEVVSIISEKYQTAFGFTEDEVVAALQEFHLEKNFEKVKAWYDGFTIGSRSDIYNPWSITKYRRLCTEGG